MANKTYESGSVLANWLGINCSQGWAEDTFLTVEPLVERTSATFGADGQMTPSKMANNGATITLTVMQTADVNLEIAAVWAEQQKKGVPVFLAPFEVLDVVGGSSHFVALNAMLTEVPGHSYGNAVGEKSWVWVCESYLETDDPSILISSLQEYLNI